MMCVKVQTSSRQLHAVNIKENSYKKYIYFWASGGLRLKLILNRLVFKSQKTLFTEIQDNEKLCKPFKLFNPQSKCKFN